MFDYMLAQGVGIDIPIITLTKALGVDAMGWNGKQLGPYMGRFNYYMQRQGKPYRLAVGKERNTVRLIVLA